MDEWVRKVGKDFFRLVEVDDGKKREDGGKEEEEEEEEEGGRGQKGTQTKRRQVEGGRKGKTHI